VFSYSNSFIRATGLSVNFYCYTRGHICITTTEYCKALTKPNKQKLIYPSENIIEIILLEPFETTLGAIKVTEIQTQNLKSWKSLKTRDFKFKI